MVCPICITCVTAGVLAGGAGTAVGKKQRFKTPAWMLVGAAVGTLLGAGLDAEVGHRRAMPNKPVSALRTSYLCGGRMPLALGDAFQPKVQPPVSSQLSTLERHGGKISIGLLGSGLGGLLTLPTRRRRKQPIG